MNQVLSFTKEDFDAAVRAEVEKHLSSKEEAVAREEAEQALQEAKETFDALKASLEARDAKIVELEEALVNLDIINPSDAEVAANEKVVELEAQLSELSQRAEVAEAALKTIAREETAASRMEELLEAKVVLENEAAEAQYAKVRDMTEEVFQSYKSELIALRTLYTSNSEEKEETAIELADLDENEVNSIAASLGCDPTDEKCIGLVKAVAEKVAEVSNARSTPAKDVDANDTDAEAKEEAKAKEAKEAPGKEVASTKLSVGEAIYKAVNQDIPLNRSLRDQITQAWDGYLAEKRGEKQSE